MHASIPSFPCLFQVAVVRDPFPLRALICLPSALGYPSLLSGEADLDRVVGTSAPFRVSGVPEDVLFLYSCPTRIGGNSSVHLALVASGIRPGGVFCRAVALPIVRLHL